MNNVPLFFFYKEIQADEEEEGQEEPEVTEAPKPDASTEKSNFEPFQV